MIGYQTYGTGVLSLLIGGGRRFGLILVFGAIGIGVGGAEEVEGLPWAFQVWEDVSGDADLAGAREAWEAGEFEPAESLDFEETDGAGVHWLKLARFEGAEFEFEPQLELRGGDVEVAQLSVGRSGEFEPMAELMTGRYVPWSLRSVDYHQNRLALTEATLAADWIYLRWRGTLPATGALQMVPAVTPRPREESYFYMKGAFRGAMLGVGIYYLFLFLRIKVASYGWLAMYVLALAAYTIVQEGDLRFWGKRPVDWEAYWMVVHGLLVVNMLGSIQFARTFLNLPLKFPRWDRLVLGVLAVNLLSIPAMAVVLQRGGNPYEFENAHTYLLIGTMFLQIGLTVACAVRGQGSAWLYALSFGVLCVGLGSDLTLSFWGYFKAEPGTLWAAVRGPVAAHSYYSGLLGEIFLMAFAVASSINEIRRSRDEATRSAIASAEEAANLKESYNQDLARELAERTADVREKNQQLEERDILKSRFFANISHEFRTPLSLIKGPAEDLARGEHGELDETGRRKLKTLLGQSTELEGLIDQLLELSRLDAGKMKLRAGRRDLVKFAKATARNFSSLAEKRGITLEFESTLPQLDVWFDEEMMRKVLNNLLSNALKFTPGGGEVRLQIEETGDEFIDMVVSDTGRGIPAGQLDRVFERFFQAESDSMQHQQGSGIGLALVKELIELHGGVISADSVEGEGSRIRFSLPRGRAHLEDDEIVESGPDSVDGVAPGPSAAEPIPRRSGSATQTARRTILVVEDFAEMREYIRERLAAKFNVLEAAEGREGLKIARREGPDLILSDVMMPVLDGLSLLTAVRDDPGLKNIPFILLTARGDDEDRLRGLAARADDYLTKPFNAQELEIRVENLLRSRAELVADHRKGDRPVVVTEMEVSSADRDFLDELNRVAEQNCSEVGFQLDELARQLKMSDATLRRRLKTLLQMTPAEYLRSYRLQKAHQFIEGRGFKTVAEVATAVGFSGPGYFARLYRKEFGVNAASALRQGAD